MSKITSGLCAGIGAAVTGGVAMVSGGNPILVALSGGLTNLISESIGEVVREDEVFTMYREKPDAFAELLGKHAEAKKDEKKKDERKADTKAGIAAFSSALDRLEKAAELQNTALAEMLRPIAEKTASETKAKAEAEVKAAAAKSEAEQIAAFAALMERAEQFRAKQVRKAEKAAEKVA